ncbi:hypothetical protein [Clostridium sp.]|jgi:hypothetical protein|uniref:hypothetical protein n=1 Tax=Clostridium sp. TaxID=1506 RepID=UPI003EEEDD85
MIILSIIVIALSSFAACISSGSAFFPMLSEFIAAIPVDLSAIEYILNSILVYKILFLYINIHF